MAQFIKVARTADLASGAATCVEVAGKTIALFNLEGSFYAVDDTCTHRGGPLSEGEVSGEEVTCPWHGAAVYNIKTGAVLGPPRRAASRATPSACRGRTWRSRC
jgi:3-phenylpropionate/trans-cinnamate dioxygenase ferredoxin component